jgi:hypothetical protein
VGDQIDESAVTPASKAHRPPLQPADHLQVHLDLERDRIRVRGRATVGRGLHAAMNYAVLCGTALSTTTLAVALCLLSHATREITFVIAAGGGLLVLLLGLIHIRTAQRGRE